MLKPQHAVVIVLAVGLAACGESSTLQVADGTGPSPKLPEPNKTLIPTVNIAPAIGWANGATPTAAAGLKVAAFAEHLDHPRWLYVLPNGDVLVAETNSPAKPDDSKGIKGWIADKVMARAGAGVPSANRITLLRDADHDGVAETRTVFIENLNSPFGMTLVGNDLYVADTDKLLRFPYQPGEDRISAQPVKVADLPGGPLNHHWTKNVIASPDGKKLYVTVGSNSNVGENGMDQEQGRAAIWEVDPATGSQRIFASGLRNPNGMAWEPVTGKLWTAVNERDEIGSDLVPDYITSVQDGGFYGWPYSYYGQHVDARVNPQNPELVAKAIAPDYAVGPHTASLGLSFAEGSKLPGFTEGVFIGQHGSWNRKPHSGYKVIFVPFAQGKPTGMPIDVLSGFLNKDEKAMGRPVGVVIDKQGDLLVADDVGNKVWRVSGQ
ncbi:sorbosone dehydrogenase family protein [Pseudomonas fragi]|uniref:Sorbosone dehydrogenase family protein n=1 Tax=Pseudomonas sp. WC2401 TaxID=3234143 RepID=A0AB39X1Y9_9PSED|nr:sorbosone dehydrogenase family protein [Pseudomonas fragi]MBM1203524.1 sorbosone dehydrogenase family protein [Pseudomonas fragi]NNA84946.1 sorbosone dehydrogenase family protein [Pseudomonas fragi]NNB07352.1 sorbosone dehydrogenase family protein [Pseudomonas fragi]NNB09436.1 sorbosone dehydrogenase family protein [Pseudomonas fragi]NNB38146.1 sorbosone dehydrogenase family protein [Pseudomonas fragi]